MIRFIIISLLFAFVFSCANTKKDKSVKQQYNYQIQTDFGNILLELYPQTPLHKANFDKLVSEKYYDSTLFHRVINNFMIQGGDPQSKYATPSQNLGNGGPNYTIPAEFVDTLYHFKGALAAARQGDQVNPTRASSGSQFYIVHGQKVTDEMLNRVEVMVNNDRVQKIAEKLFNDSTNITIKNKLTMFRNTNQKDSFDFYVQVITQMAEKQLGNNRFKYSPQAREKYLQVGGSPQLDGSYTVFGYVKVGLNVLDSIAVQKLGRNDRPEKDIRMIITKIKKQ
jgi:cyclophilin family peptidyl-prolyl cis-trans isomerase